MICQTSTGRIGYPTFFSCLILQISDFETRLIHGNIWYKHCINFNKNKKICKNKITCTIITVHLQTCFMLLMLTFTIGQIYFLFETKITF